jgi:excisionase family DNA binding protein
VLAKTLTTKEAMAGLEVSRQEIYELIENGVLRTVKLHQRGRFKVSAVDVERLRGRMYAPLSARRRRDGRPWRGLAAGSGDEAAVPARAGWKLGAEVRLRR